MFRDRAKQNSQKILLWRETPPAKNSRVLGSNLLLVSTAVAVLKWLVTDSPGGWGQGAFTDIWGCGHLSNVL